MTAAKKAKAMGMKNLKQAMDLGWPRSSLVDMANSKPDRFEIVILGCIEKIKLAEANSKPDRFEIVILGCIEKIKLAEANNQ